MKTYKSSRYGISPQVCVNYNYCGTPCHNWETAIL